MSGSSYDNIPAAVRAQWAGLVNFDNPPTHLYAIVPLTIVMSVLVTAIVGARIWVRVFVQRKVDASDWLIFAILIPTLMYLAMVCVAIQLYGYNKHVYDLDTPDLIVALKLFFIGYFVYFWLSGLVRLSILFFYLRIAGRDTNRLFIRSVWGLIFFTILYSFCFSVSLVFTCNPVSGFWNRIDPNWSERHTHRCFNEGAHIMTASGVSALDLAVALMPTMLFWNLHLPRRQKIALWSLFAIGCMTAVASLIRFYYIYLDFYKSYDFTWWGFYLWVWTDVELSVAIICASAPALKAIFTKFFENGPNLTSRARVPDLEDKMSHHVTTMVSMLDKHPRRCSLHELDVLTPNLEDSWDRYGFSDDDGHALGSMTATTRAGCNDDSEGSILSSTAQEYESSKDKGGHPNMVVHVRTTLSVVQAERKPAKVS